MDRFKGFLSGYMGRMENQMDNNVEHEMETGNYVRVSRVYNFSTVNIGIAKGPLRV